MAPCTEPRLLLPLMKAIIVSVVSMTAPKLEVLVALVPALERMSSTSSHTRSEGTRPHSAPLIVRLWSWPVPQLCEMKQCDLPVSSGRASTGAPSRRHRSTFWAERCLRTLPKKAMVERSSVSSSEPRMSSEVTRELVLYSALGSKPGGA